jgi:hypothetical protein
VSRYWAVVALLLLSGCSRDREVLDRFSHSYTSFCDAEIDAREASAGLLFLLDEARQLRSAANRAVLDKKLSLLGVEANRQIESLDGTVSDLTKVANETQTGNYRGEVLDVAKSAKEVQLQLVSQHRLILRRFNIQEKVADPQELSKLNREIQEKQALLSAAERKCQEKFIVLKQESPMKEYPLKNRF